MKPKIGKLNPVLLDRILPEMEKRSDQHWATSPPVEPEASREAAGPKSANCSTVPYGDTPAHIRVRLAPTPAEVIAKAQKKARRNKWQDAYALQIKQAGLPKPVEEYQAIPGRKFRWDFAWPECLILVEIQGGIWSKGKTGHTSGVGVNRDCEKANMANLASWCCLSFTSDHIRDGTALEQSKQALQLFQPFA